MPTYKTVSGFDVEYRAEATLAAFISRLEKMLTNPDVTEDQMIVTIYGPDNPIMNHTVIPGRYAVTADTLANPAYEVMTDLLFRKGLAQRGDNIDDIATTFTMTPSQVAAKFGIHVSGVHLAIETKRLTAWKKGRRIFLHPLSVNRFKLSRRGPKPKGK